MINKGPIRKKEAEIGMLFIKACGFFVKAFLGAKKARVHFQRMFIKDYFKEKRSDIFLCGSIYFSG